MQRQSIKDTDSHSFVDEGFSSFHPTPMRTKDDASIFLGDVKTEFPTIDTKTELDVSYTSVRQRIIKLTKPQLKHIIYKLSISDNRPEDLKIVSKYAILKQIMEQIGQGKIPSVAKTKTGEISKDREKIAKAIHNLLLQKPDDYELDFEMSDNEKKNEWFMNYVDEIEVQVEESYDSLYNKSTRSTISKQSSDTIEKGITKPQIRRVVHELTKGENEIPELTNPNGYPIEKSDIMDNIINEIGYGKLKSGTGFYDFQYFMDRRDMQRHINWLLDQKPENYRMKFDVGWEPQKIWLSNLVDRIQTEPETPNDNVVDRVLTKDQIRKLANVLAKEYKDKKDRPQTDISHYYILRDILRQIGDRMLPKGETWKNFYVAGNDVKKLEKNINWVLDRKSKNYKMKYMAHEQSEKEDITRLIDSLGMGDVKEEGEQFVRAITKDQLQKFAEQLTKDSSEIPGLNKKTTKSVILKELLRQITNNKLPASSLNKSGGLTNRRDVLAKTIHSVLEGKSKNYELEYNVGDNEMKNLWVGDQLRAFQEKEAEQPAGDQKESLEQKQQFIDQIMRHIMGENKKKIKVSASLTPLLETKSKKEIKNQPKSKFKINYV